MKQADVCVSYQTKGCMTSGVLLFSRSILFVFARHYAALREYSALRGRLIWCQANNADFSGNSHSPVMFITRMSTPYSILQGRVAQHTCKKGGSEAGSRNLVMPSTTASLSVRLQIWSNERVHSWTSTVILVHDGTTNDPWTEKSSSGRCV
jgi:hypothetical protein